MRAVTTLLAALLTAPAVAHAATFDDLRYARLTAQSGRLVWDAQQGAEAALFTSVAGHRFPLPIRSRAPFGMPADLGLDGHGRVVATYVRRGRAREYVFTDRRSGAGFERPLGPRLAGPVSYPTRWRRRMAIAVGQRVLTGAIGGPLHRVARRLPRWSPRGYDPDLPPEPSLDLRGHRLFIARGDRQAGVLYEYSLETLRHRVLTRASGPGDGDEESRYGIGQLTRHGGAVFSDTFCNGVAGCEASVTIGDREYRPCELPYEAVAGSGDDLWVTDRAFIAHYRLSKVTQPDPAHDGCDLPIADYVMGGD